MKHLGYKLRKDSPRREQEPQSRNEKLTTPLKKNCEKRKAIFKKYVSFPIKNPPLSKAELKVSGIVTV